MYVPNVIPRELSVRAFEYIDSNDTTWYSPVSYTHLRAHET